MIFWLSGQNIGVSLPIANNHEVNSVGAQSGESQCELLFVLLYVCADLCPLKLFMGIGWHKLLLDAKK